MEFSGTSLDDRAVAAAQSKEAAGMLIEEFKPYLYTITRRYANAGQGVEFDEFNADAMLAFYEAINSYEKGKGHFLPFAGQIIRRRMIDRLREMYRTKRLDAVTLSFDHAVNDSDSSGEMTADSGRLLYTASTERYERDEQQWMLKEEIAQFNRELEQWEITLEQLVEQSPKHAAIREECRVIINRLCIEPPVLETLFVKRYFPVKSVAQLTKTSPKKLKRFRNYIIAALIVKTGGYQYIAEYIG